MASCIFGLLFRLGNLRWSLPACGDNNTPSSCAYIVYTWNEYAGTEVGRDKLVSSIYDYSDGTFGSSFRIFIDMPKRLGTEFDFLLAVCELVKIIRGGGIHWRERVNCVRFAFVCCWLCLLRNNGVYVLAAMAPFLMFYTKRYYKRIGLICMSIIVGYYIYAGPLMDVVQIPKGDSREAMTMIVQPLARIYREEGKSSLSQDEKEMIRRLFGNNTPWYESHISDAAKCQFDSREFLDHITKYMKLYIELGIRYPDVYLDAILANTYGNWYPHEILPDSTCYRMYFEFPEVSAKEHGSQFPVLYDFLQKLCRESTYLKVPFLYLIFCTGIVSWTSLFLLAQIIIRKQYRKILAFVPFGALFLTILLGPVALLRYTYPLMVGIPVLFAIVYWDELSKRV